MPTLEADSLLIFKGKDGDKTIVYPITRASNVDGLSKVGQTGSYNDLTDKPTFYDLIEPLVAKETLDDNDIIPFVDTNGKAGKTLTVAGLRALLGGGENGKYGGLVTVTETGIVDIIAKPGTVIDAAVVKRIGTGDLLATSIDEDVVTASMEGDTLKVTVVGLGQTTVAVSVTGDDTFAPASVGIKFNVIPYLPVLEENDWTMVTDATNRDYAKLVWDVGDVKSCHINGTVGRQSINTTLWVHIIGFNHNAALEGNLRTHFGGFKTAKVDGIDVCLVDSGYGSDFYKQGYKYFNMNHWANFNYGGWAACDLRYDVLGSTDVAPDNYGARRQTTDKGYDPTDNCAKTPVAGTLMAALPADLRSVMKPITKYTDNNGGPSSASREVTATIDYLPLFAEFEIFGESIIANSAEQNFQEQYAYYANGNSKIRNKHNDTETAAMWSLRSPKLNSSVSFTSIETDGTVFIAYNACTSCGLAPLFAV